MGIWAWMVGTISLCGFMGRCAAQEVIITVFESSQGGLARRAAAEGEPHIERRIDGEQHTLIIHHHEGQFVLTPGFSVDSILRQRQATQWSVSDSTLEELCRWAYPILDQGSVILPPAKAGGLLADFRNPGQSRVGRERNLAGCGRRTLLDNFGLYPGYYYLLSA